MDENQNGPQDERLPEVKVRVAPGIRLTKGQEDLMTQAFAQEEAILVQQEFRSGYSGALVILVSVGTGRAPVVVKLAHPHDLQREYEAFEEYVRQISPQNIAHLQGKPLVAPDGQLGLIQYTFAGGESHLPTNSLQKYYESNGAEEMAAVLNRIFRVFGRHWWANNRAESYVLDEYYDRMLPVHLQASLVDSALSPDHIITAGETSVLAVEEIDIGQVIQLFGLEVTKSSDDGRKMTLLALPPRNEASAPLRIRVMSDEASTYCPGEAVESLTVKVTATRMTLLGEAARAALPGFDPQAKQFNLSGLGEGDGVVLPNPLSRLPEWLYNVVETKVSIIHGDLNLQNVLVDVPTGFSWLIDFAETRIGPTLLDLQRLEVQVITKLMPAGGQVPLGAVVEMMTRLHADPPLPAPPQPALQEPFTVLVAIRRLARQYLMDDLDWNEYYFGLIMVLIGALKYDELDDTARRLALVSAAAASSLIGQPLQTGAQADATQTDILPAVLPQMSGQPEVMETVQPAAAPVSEAALPQPELQEAAAQPAKPAARSVPSQMELRAAPQQARPATTPAAPKRSRRWVGIGMAAVAVLLIVLIGWQLAGRVPSQDGDTTSGDGQAASAVLSPTTESNAAAAVVDPTQTPSATRPPTATPLLKATTTEGEKAAAVGLEGASTPTGEATKMAATGLDTPTSAPSISPTPPPTAPPPPPQSEEATLKTLVTVNLRSGPGVEYPVVGSLSPVSTTELLGRTAGSSDVWYEIAFPQESAERAWVTGDSSLVEVSGAVDVPVVARPAVPTPLPVVAATTGVLYFSATDSSGNDNIYRVAVSGDAKPALVVEQARQPARSPNGQRLAFQSTSNGTLGVASVDDGSQNRVRYSSSPEDALPSWSPASDTIVYASNREGDRNWRLYLGWAGSGNSADELTKGTDPDWHSSRDLIVFKGCDDFGARCGLWTVAPNGGARAPLTDNPSDARPKWSPDGKIVVFMSGERDGNWELYTVDVSSGTVEQLTDHPAIDGLPAISPDGRSVAFLSSRNGSWGLWTVPISGGTPQLAVTLDASLPDWRAQGVEWAQ